MTVSVIYLILITVMALKGEIASTSVNELIAILIILVACGIISICSRLNDLKRK